MESMSEKWVPFRTDLILGKRKKSHGARSGEYGKCSKVAMFLSRETDKKTDKLTNREKLTNTQCEQRRYRDRAPLRGLPKGSAFCHALILGGAEESLYRRFRSLFGLEVGIRNEKRFFSLSENQNPTLSLNCMDFYQSRKLTNKQKQNNESNLNYQ